VYSSRDVGGRALLISRRSSRGRLLALAAALAAVSWTGAAVGTAATGPPRIQWGSLAQVGPNLVWRAQLSGPFTAAGLARQNETLCVLIERVTTSIPTGQVCLEPAGRRSALVNVPLGGRGRTIAATITRPTPTTVRAEFLPGVIGLGYRDVRWQVQTVISAPNCVAPSTTPSACTTQFPARGQLLKLHTPRLVGCLASGPGFVSHGPSRGRMVALTFDDGPWQLTPQFLSVLERKHVVGTFFEIGEQIATYGQGGAIERRMLKDGDMIGDHTWSHINVSGDGPVAASQISMTADAIRGATRGFRPCLFRAPGGAVSGALISEARGMGFTIIQWDVDPRDWARPGTGAIYGTVTGNARPGSIILQHDGGGDRSETLAALPQEIDTLRRAGYHFVTVTQLLGYRLIYK
jgi:peptidoglycan/xylan/chitin deacetylase (PgdA/CDA1 family)